MDMDKLSREEQALIQMAANQLRGQAFHSDPAWIKVKRHLRSEQIYRRRKRFFRYAVAIFLLICGGISVWLYPEKQQKQVTVFSEIKIATGSPELILATGERVLLDSLHSAELVQPGAVLVFDTVSQQLSYQKKETLRSEDEMVYNRLYIPKGGEYSLILADGSKVWLNAESSLRFPVKFGADMREVFLEGEAYFEVASDNNRPFIVQMGQRSVEVLGTAFNVCAYRQDNYWHTSLASGKVKVSSEKNTFLLSPSEQYIENLKTGKKEVRKVDVSQYSSWRTGTIRFRGERLEDIVQKLERWYDFHMFYSNDELRDMRFRGTINKYDSFDTVLRNLEQTTDIRFDIKGNTVIAHKIYK